MKWEPEGVQEQRGEVMNRESGLRGEGEGGVEKKKKRENINSELCNEFMPGWQIFMTYWKNSWGGVLTQLGLRSIH